MPKKVEKARAATIGDLVRVEFTQVWGDIGYVYHDSDSIKNEPEPFHMAVGFLVKDDKSGVAVAQEFSWRTPEQFDQPYSRIVNIPRALVKEVLVWKCWER